MRGGSIPAIPLPQVDPLPETSPPPESVEDSPPLAMPLSLHGLEFSLDTASLDALEAVARRVTRTQVGSWFSDFQGSEEVALLSTCHRVELALLVRSPGEVNRWREVLPGDPGRGISARANRSYGISSA